MTEPRGDAPASKASTGPGATPVVVVMGVAGSGKTHIGRAVADRFDWTFVDADDVHPPSNVAKMRAGVALTDADRLPWLETLNRLLRSAQADGEALVLSCSALKRSYRRTLFRGVSRRRLIHLDVPAEVVAERVGARRGHFLSAALVGSQFAALEVPSTDEAVIVDADRPETEVVDEVVDALHRWVERTGGAR